MKISVSKLSALVLLSTLVLFSARAFAGGDPDSFLLLDKSGKVMGKASYNIDKIKEGYRIRSRFQYKSDAASTAGGSRADANAADLASQQGRSGSTAMEFTATYRVTADGDAIDGSLQNGPLQTTLSFTTSKDRSTVSVGMVHFLTPSNPITLPMPKPDFLIAPNNDPSAMQILLTTALAHPHADGTYLLLVPPSTPHGGPRSIYVSLGSPTDAAGTLDGKPVALKQYALKFYEGEAQLYADANGTLMEADLDPLGVKYVRVKFALTAPVPAK